jgi:hypothetical protein
MGEWLIHYPIFISKMELALNIYINPFDNLCQCVILISELTQVVSEEEVV